MRKTMTAVFSAIGGAALAAALPLADDVALEQARGVLEKLTLEQKVELTGGCATMYLKAFPEAGIPREWAFSDCSHAVKPEHKRDDFGYVDGAEDAKSTTMPPLSALAMTWNRELAAEHGRVMSEQMRARGKDQMLGPGVNMARTPLCGRNWEYMTEDPYLAGALAVPLIRAVQEGGVVATVKHFCLNVQEWNRMEVDMCADERTLNEIYLPAFRAAVVEGGALSVMTAYNRVNGTFASENAYLQQGILRNRWGFKGMIVTDWGGQHSTAFAALNGGNCEMNWGAGITYFTDFYHGKQPLLDAVKNGEVPAAVVDEMALHTLWTMAKVGFFTGDQPKGRILVEDHREACRAIAAEAITLLKNEAGVLPLRAAKLAKVVVIGRQADLEQCHLGCSCESRTEREITPFAAIRDYLGPEVEVTLLPLGIEAGDGSGRPAAIPLLQLETYRPSSKAAAFAERGWEVWHWPEGHKWVDEPQLKGYVDYPTGEKGEAVRYAAKVRIAEGGCHSFALDESARVSDATVLLDGAVVFHINGGRILKNEIVELARGSIHALRLDVANCEGERAFEFGWLTPAAYAGDREGKLAKLRAADAVIAFTGTQLGYGRAKEQEGEDLPSMSEPAGHDSEIAELMGMGLKNLVVVNRSGTPLEMPWAEKCQTLVQSPYLGQNGAESLAKVLFGEVNPSGKLAVSWPKRYADTPVARCGSYGREKSVIGEGIFMGYRWYDTKGIATEFPFGHGLSYTKFEYADAAVRKVRGEIPTWEVAVLVRNAGRVAGKETVQLYVTPAAAPVERPSKELKGFAKTKLLAAGKQERMDLRVTARDLAFYDPFLHRWHAVKGEYGIEIGASSADIRSKVTVTLDRDMVFSECNGLVGCAARSSPRTD